MSNRSQGSWALTTLLVFTVICIVALNVLQKHQLLDATTEGALRLLINSTLAVVLIWNCFRSALVKSLRSAILLTIIAALGETVLDFTEDLQSLAEVPLIGRNSSSRRSLEAVLAAGWMLGGFYVMLSSVRIFRRTRLDDIARMEALRQSQAETLHANEALELALSELRATQSQILQRERLSAVGQMASGVAHDLNNALSPATIFVELLLQDDNLRPEQRENLESVRQSLADAATTVSGLQLFYGKPNSAVEAGDGLVDVRKLIRQVVSMTRPKWKAESERFGYDVTLDVDLGDVPKVRINSTELRMVVTNLIFNSVEAMPEGGRISISCYEEDANVVISLADTGEGMDAATIKRCFEPFYTTKPRGSGLGLSVCFGVIERAGGTIVVTSEPRKRTEFKIRLPAVAQETRESPRKSTAAGPARLLLVDDDEVVSHATAALLVQLGAEVITECSGQAALRRYREDGPFDLVVTDMGMAGMDGKALIEATRNRNSNQRVAVISGWSENEVISRFHDTSPPT